MGERYVPIGDDDIVHLIEEIRAKRPDFILNNLIGPSSYTFLAAYNALGTEDAGFRPENCPVVSCNLYENETMLLGAAAAGHFTVSSYFRSLVGEENSLFAQRVKAGDAFFVQAYAAVIMIAEAIRRTGTDDPQKVLEDARTHETATPLGRVQVDRATNHVSLHAHIGRARPDGDFDIVHRSKDTIAPDPFLTATPLERPYAELLAQCARIGIASEQAWPTLDDPAENTVSTWCSSTPIWGMTSSFPGRPGSRPCRSSR